MNGPKACANDESVIPGRLQSQVQVKEVSLPHEERGHRHPQSGACTNSGQGRTPYWERGRPRPHASGLQTMGFAVTLKKYLLKTADVDVRAPSKEALS